MRATLERSAEPRDVRGVDGAALEDAMVRTVAYADVFDFALTPAELHRYLVGVAADPTRVAASVSEPRPANGRLEHRDGLVTLAGRGDLAARRRQRQRTSARSWPRVTRYGRMLATIPFVRMVGVTGGLAAGNAAPGDDVDLLLVTEHGGLWSARLGSVALARVASRAGDELCPNYLLTESALALRERDLYTAMELAHLVPLAGRPTYRRLRRSNPWVGRFLPNSAGPPEGARRLRPLTRGIRPALEAVLRTAPGRRMEAWESARKIPRLRDLAAAQGIDADANAMFSDERCKGHFHGHGPRIRSAYESRARALGLEPGWESTDG